MDHQEEDLNAREQFLAACKDAQAFVRESRAWRRLARESKFGPAFWTIASALSLAVSVILIVMVIFLARELFVLNGIIEDHLVGGLYDNFAKMDQAHIVTTINVKDTIQVVDEIPVVFALALNQDTEVSLTQDTHIQQATIYLNQAAVPIDIVLPAGTKLNIALDLVVPVSQSVPVNLSIPVDMNIPVDIALDQTDLHEPFIGLQNVVIPFTDLLAELPDSWSEVPFCQSWLGWICPTY
jgi:hypothetical protein